MKRRNVLGVLGGVGVGNLAFQRHVAAQAARTGEVSVEMLDDAAWVAGIRLSGEDKAKVARALERTLGTIEDLREIPIDYRTGPAMQFVPGALPDFDAAYEGRELEGNAGQRSVGDRPGSGDDLAFLPLTELSGLIRERKVSSVELTRLYLERLKRFDPVLNCVVTFTEDVALEQARKADEEIAAGKYRGPVHGVPWGAKDLIAYPGYRTTWGANHYKRQQFDHTATVAAKLDEAGAVLVAKLTLGALAEGDRWFGGMTRNPWNPEQGSSGSSAGSASAVSAGLVGYAIGSETLGSIVSPCARCGVTGLRPTFGRVSRYGCMPLSWTMDKLGPIARSVEDCALVFRAIHGADPRDPSAVSAPFAWPVPTDLKEMRVGYFEDTESGDLDVLRDIGVRLVKIDLPGRDLARKVSYILSVEAAAAFDEVTSDGVSDGFNNWAERFRRMRYVSAIDYIRANRLRSKLMQDVGEATNEVDAWIGGNDLVVTNLTGHPTVVMPHGLTKGRDGVEAPSSITFSGQPYSDDRLMALAAAFQDRTGHHLARPPLEG